ncbi:hypothetical protein P7K49_023732 [Saguinus oedipus]|uniref:Uncharacterized protein n=1 Tax=Saguinus oedipus TaxID=9490 RepID=A0ABQ9UMH8_SAGOE|nr:hypothetical protein P7K49_023732 [Saguinus oedipus]
MVFLVGKRQTVRTATPAWCQVTVRLNKQPQLLFLHPDQPRPVSSSALDDRCPHSSSKELSSAVLLEQNNMQLGEGQAGSQGTASFALRQERMVFASSGRLRKEHRGMAGECSEDQTVAGSFVNDVSRKGLERIIKPS